MSPRPKGASLHPPAALSLAGAAALAVVAYRARHVAPYRPRLDRLALPLPPGHAGLAGLRIGFVSDTHVGPFFSSEDLGRATDLLRAEHPDLVLLGGDYVAESPRYAASLPDVLRPLVQSARLGAFAVFGNHDLANSAERTTSALRQAGATVLRNEAVAIATGRGTLWLAGVDDALLGRPDPAAAFAPIPAGAAVLALWHEPDWAERAAALGAFAQLSGHSHGGQIHLPGFGAFAAPAGGRRYPRGRNLAAGMPVYTSRGVGVYRPPVRFNCPPEVTLVTLAAS